MLRAGSPRHAGDTRDGGRDARFVFCTPEKREKNCSYSEASNLMGVLLGFAHKQLHAFSLIPQISSKAKSTSMSRQTFKKYHL